MWRGTRISVSPTNDDRSSTGPLSYRSIPSIKCALTPTTNKVTSNRISGMSASPRQQKRYIFSIHFKWTQLLCWNTEIPSAWKIWGLFKCRKCAEIYAIPNKTAVRYVIPQKSCRYCCLVQNGIPFSAEVLPLKFDDLCWKKDEVSIPEATHTGFCIILHNLL